jgi:hypothetical protein
VFVGAIIGMAVLSSTSTGLAALMKPLVDQGLVARDPAMIKLIPPLKMDAGSPQRWVKNVESQATLFSSKCDDEKLDRILEFFDWSLSAEGRDFSFYGFKDKDYLV